MKREIGILKCVLTLMLLMYCSLAFTQGAFSIKSEGHYWTRGGEKIEGEFKISYKSHLAGGTVVKHYINGKKVGRVDVSNLQSLVLRNDSFIVGYNFTVGAWGASYSSDLLMVENTGPINLYVHCRKVKETYGNSVPIRYLVCEFVVKKEGSNSFLGISTKAQFERYFIPLIEHDEKLKNKIMEVKKRDWLDSLPSFIREYNGRH